MGAINWYEFDIHTKVVLVTTVGARAMSTRLLTGKFSLSQNCAIIIPRASNTDVVFYEMAMRRLFEYERTTISLIMQPSLRFIDLNRFSLPVPPAEEQEKIVENLEAKTEALEITKQGAEREILLLREFHTRLIADVVTGKLDVREAAAKLPAETGDLETEEEIEKIVSEAEEEGLDVEEQVV